MTMKSYLKLESRQIELILMQKADSVSGELNSKSPTNEFTIVTVTVVMSSNGFQDKFWS